MIEGFLDNGGVYQDGLGDGVYTLQFPKYYIRADLLDNKCLLGLFDNDDRLIGEHILLPRDHTNDIKEKIMNMLIDIIYKRKR